MAYPQHWLLQFGGSLGTATPETWSCGIRLMKTGDWLEVGFDPGAGYLTSIAVPGLAAWFGRSTSRISNLAKLRWVKCNEINDQGEYADASNVNEYFWPVPVSGGATTGVLPYQASVVLSWETNAADRGLGSKGRIYSPAPTVDVIQATGLFLDTTAQEMATSAAALLNSIDDSVGTGQIRPAIVSRGKKVTGGYGPGVAHQIDRVRVDNRVDTQRRRAAQLVAVSKTTNVSY